MHEHVDMHVQTVSVSVHTQTHAPKTLSGSVYSEPTLSGAALIRRSAVDM